VLHTLPRVTLLALALTAAPGCEIIDMIRGFAAAADEIGNHLESDLKSELTDAKISKVIEVTPLLTEFSKTAKTKWQPDPHAPDFSQLASAMGGLAEYIAFFESHGTRLTEYYVDVAKIADGRSLLTLRKAHEEATTKLKQERTELEGKIAAASGDEKKQLEDQLGVNAKASETLQQQFDQTMEARKAAKSGGNGGFTLSDEEVARVQARLPEITKAFDGAGYRESK
jgi:hypothetical protein